MSPPSCSFSPDNNCFDNTFQPGSYKRKGELAETGQRQLQGKGNGSRSTDTNVVGHFCLQGRKQSWLGATSFKEKKNPEIKKKMFRYFHRSDVYSINQSTSQSGRQAGRRAAEGGEGPSRLPIHSPSERQPPPQINLFDKSLLYQHPHLWKSCANLLPTVAALTTPTPQKIGQHGQLQFK